MKVMELDAERARLNEAHENTQPLVSLGTVSQPSASGGRFVRIIHLLVLPGTSFPMTTHALVRTDGVKTACWVSVTKSAACVSL